MAPQSQTQGPETVCSSQDDFYVKFWGVRGSIACSSPDVMRYGGNTSCLEVRCGEQVCIFDAGTGLRYLGLSLASTGGLKADLFLTHTHFDHVCGLPFFKPFYEDKNTFQIWSGRKDAELTTKQALSALMMSPLFPVPPEIFRAEVTYKDFSPGETLTPTSAVSIDTCALNHPDGATGYRVNYRGRSIAYVTDTEHTPDGPDKAILDLIDGADVFVYDATYTDEEYKIEAGKGHSTWEEGARLADLAGVGCYVPFHHDPDHDDAFMDKVAEELALRRPGSVVAQEGLVLAPELLSSKPLRPPVTRVTPSRADA